MGMALVGALAVSQAALAAGGCGAGWHRGPRGNCVRNVVVIAPEPVTAVAATSVSPGTSTVVVTTPASRPCPIGYHLGPGGRRCWRN